MAISLRASDRRAWVARSWPNSTIILRWGPVRRHEQQGRRARPPLVSPRVAFPPVGRDDRDRTENPHLDHDPSLPRAAPPTHAPGPPGPQRTSSPTPEFLQDASSYCRSSAALHNRREARRCHEWAHVRRGFRGFGPRQTATIATGDGFLTDGIVSANCDTRHRRQWPFPKPLPARSGLGIPNRSPRGSAGHLRHATG